MIYNRHDLLQLVYSQILVRVQAPNQHPPVGLYIPNGEEIKLATRSIASMPYDVIKRRNAFVYLDSDEKAQAQATFSVTGYFTALQRIIINGYG